MRGIIFVLKVVETILSLICILIHVCGFSDHDEPFRHLMLMCGTYFGMFVTSLMGCMVQCLGLAVPLIIEMIVCSLGAVLFIAASMLSMVEAEHDYHLLYLTHKDEMLHKFFSMSRSQSIVSLFTGMWFMMHTVLVADLMLITKPDEVHPTAPYQPLHLTCCCASLGQCTSELVENNQCLKHFSVERQGGRPIDQEV